MNKYEKALHLQNVADRIKAVKILKNKGYKLEETLLKDIEISPETLKYNFSTKGEWKYYIACRIRRNQFKLDSFMFEKDLKFNKFSEEQIKDIMLQYYIKYFNNPQKRSCRVSDYNIIITKNGIELKLNPLEEIFKNIKKEEKEF